MLAIIGGSGLSQLACLEVRRRELVRTPYGEPSGTLSHGTIAGREVVFLARHGYGHTIPPHRVNYRANIWALVKEAGASHIISVASVGGIRSDLGPGSLVLPQQILDYTWGRAATFHDGDDGSVLHVDFTEPYDQGLRQELLQAAAELNLTLADQAVYAASQGPRLETAAEINRLERDGADIVGMTGMPEATLARELNTPYAAVCAVANWAAGRADSAHGIQLEQIEAVLHQALASVRQLLEQYCQKG